MNKQQAKKAGLERRKRRVRAKVLVHLSVRVLQFTAQTQTFMHSLLTTLLEELSALPLRLTQSSVLLARLAPTRRQLSS